MFFIHDTSCISAQQTFAENIFLQLDEAQLNEPVNKKYMAAEPTYAEIPPGILRRMGRSVRFGIGTAMPLIQKMKTAPDGFIIGTSIGGMEDCIKFLNQIIEYKEGQLTPTNFVQSTPNAVAGQLGLLTKNKGYNITHVHRGFSFEAAAIDAAMMIKEKPKTTFLLGTMDEISSYHYNIERLEGLYKDEEVGIKDFYTTATKGTVAGEGAAMFIVNGEAAGAKAQLKDIHIFHSTDAHLVTTQLQDFIRRNNIATNELLVLTGENGDNRTQHFYSEIESGFSANTTIARYKHLCGEHPTTPSFACWIATEILQQQLLPDHMLKQKGNALIKQALIYNHYKGEQHSFMLLEANR